jgi:hypothetical protein
MFIAASPLDHRRLVHWTREQSTTGEAMSRWTTTLAAAAASATVAVAVVALPALGSGSAPPSAAAVAAKRAACLKEQPADKCKPGAAKEVDMAKIIACVRSHGLDAPSDPKAFKEWVARTEASDPATIQRVIPACKMLLAPPADDQAPKDKLPPCGVAVPNDDAPKPDAPKPNAPEADTGGASAT